MRGRIKYLTPLIAIFFYLLGNYFLNKNIDEYQEKSKNKIEDILSIMDQKIDISEKLLDYENNSVIGEILIKSKNTIQDVEIKINIAGSKGKTREDIKYNFTDYENVLDGKAFSYKNKLLIISEPDEDGYRCIVIDYSSSSKIEESEFYITFLVSALNEEKYKSVFKDNEYKYDLVNMLELSGIRNRIYALFNIEK